MPNAAAAHIHESVVANAIPADGTTWYAKYAVYALVITIPYNINIDTPNRCSTRLL